MNTVVGFPWHASLLASCEAAPRARSCWQPRIHERGHKLANLLSGSCACTDLSVIDTFLMRPSGGAQAGRVEDTTLDMEREKKPRKTRTENKDRSHTHTRTNDKDHDIERSSVTLADRTKNRDH